jgi:two-component system chemotaxis sensor kinase CheA
MPAVAPRRKRSVFVMDELTKEFLIESCENLDRLEQDFVALEKHSGADGRLASIFRTIHSIKGNCGFLGLPKLESVTHAGEGLLSRLRDDELAVTSEIISALLALVDVVREILRQVQTTSSEGDADYTLLIANLNRLRTGSGETRAAGARDCSAQPIELDTSVDADGSPDGSPDASIDIPANGGIRVDNGLLDKLTSLVGELALARNQILQFSAEADNAILADVTQRLNLITAELQEGVMKTRMQPIGNLWSRVPRIVRDVAQICGKQVRVEIEGGETELDKTIVEAIKDPLTHIIRNSVDHGIESPEIRRAAGKPETGRLFLRAFHEGGQVNIEIADDGAGINIDRVKKKGIERGLITAAQAACMDEREALDLIFLPGFSTAERITNLSGRGVGMDVVKINIESIGGTVDLQSTPGSGTTLRMRIPLLPALASAQIVSSGSRQRLS